ncbi:collagen binding domain-containing protein [Paenibacillus puldeungensis]|uniref:Collagen binding domain-containing protein n=1 Tax=Paenibacillus puldeungensis TaxID=696536 RepID=A0ABW3S226_9BACL
MKKKMMVIMMACMLVLQGLFGAGIMPVSADSAEGPASSSEGSASVTDDTYGGGNADSILTKITLKDKQGTVIDAVYNPERIERSHLGDAVSIEYEWALENGHGYKAGDKFEFDIPKEFKLYNKIDGSLIMDGGESIGTFTVETNGHVIFLFNDKVDNSNVKGTFRVQTEFSQETINGSVEVPIYFPIRGGVQVTKVFFAPKGGDLLTKDGVADRDKKIDWSIDVNTSLNKIDNAVVTDQIPAGLTLDPASIKVYELQANVDGPPTLGSEIASDAGKFTVSSEPDGSAFQIKFTDPSISSAYRITYSTAVTSEDESTFTNKAEIKGDNSISKQVDKTVTVQREKLLTKQAVSYNEETQTVLWKVVYNAGEKLIPLADAIIHDRFDNGLELAGPVKVLDAAGKDVDSSLYTVTPVTDSSEGGKNGFDLKFKQGIDAAYTIVYSTKAVDRVYQNTTVTNSVYTTLNGKDNRGSAQQTLESGIGVKSLSGFDYSSKELTWTIVVNKDKQPMTNLKIEDTFSGGGLSFIPGSVVVVSSGGDPVISHTVVADQPDKGFKLTFTGTFTDTYTITYKTKFTPANSNYKNTAQLDWTERTGPTTYPIEATFTPNDYTKNNGAKDGSYDARTKEITWNIVANYNEHSVKGAVITDELQEGQSLILDTVKVYKATVEPNGNPVKGVEVKLDPSKISYTGNQLRVQLGDINEPYWISFKTKLDKTLVVDQIPNVAVLSGAGGEKWSWSKTVNIPHGEVYVSKSGVQNDDKINWQIKINEGQSYVENAKIVDTPSSNQILKPETFKLYKAVVDPSGNVAPGDLLTEVKDYKLVINNDEQNDRQTFELTFVKPIGTAYILQYSSEIAVSADKEQVTNAVSFTGDGVTIGTKETTKSIEVRYSTGSGTGSGLRGSLVITKVDKDNHDLKLAGAKFKLLSGKGEVIGEKTTDTDGKITFTKLLYDTYSLVETEAPTGYATDSKASSIKIDSQVQQTGGVKTWLVENAKKPVSPTDPAKGTLVVIKVDKDDPSKVLAGATFVLQDADKKKEPVMVTTDAYGKAVFVNLAYDRYVLKETAAPAGYVLDGTERQITLDAGIKKTADTLTVTVVNSKKTETPGNPGNPGNPGTPENPSNPSNPSNPTSPTNPTNPTNPGTPINPGGGTTPPGGGDVTVPDDSIPADGTNGQKPTPKPGGPTDIELDDDGNPLGGSDGDRPGKGKIPGLSVLPKTGENSPWPIQIAGATLIIMGIALRRKYVKQK